MATHLQLAGTKASPYEERRIQQTRTVCMITEIALAYSCRLEPLIRNNQSH
jgi:hypothetical protein